MDTSSACRRCGDRSGCCACDDPYGDIVLKSPPQFTTSNPLVHLRKPPDPLTGFHDAYDVTWVATCGWNARDVTNDDGPKRTYRDLTTNNIFAVTCTACLDAVILQGDAARDRFLELERRAGEVQT